MKNRRLHYRNLSIGLFLFSIGFFKKTVLADSLALMADQGFNDPTCLHFVSAWVTSLSYTFQLYFDFSGYTDMAMGAAYMMNIRLPANFNSPYKALDIQDFWRRWHITLGRFLRRYLYIPLGGNRRGEANTVKNLFITFLLGGIWHGAGWTFVVWGALHGIGAAVHRLWLRQPYRLPKWIAWFLTFQFVNICWVFFRADSFEKAYAIIGKMFDIRSISYQNILEFISEKSGFLYNYIDVAWDGFIPGLHLEIIFIVVFSFIGVCFFKNTVQMAEKFHPSPTRALFGSLLFFFGILTFISDIPSKFIYYQF